MLIKSTPVPPCGWNSYDSYGVYINEEQAIANLELFVQKLAPYGYEYFVLDACWYADGDFMDNYRAEQNGETRFMHVDEWGRFIGSPKMFPHGLRALSDRCHELGVKFGVHIMRGMPTVAYERNTPVKGHPTAHAKDIVDLQNLCAWCKYTMGINMDAPGAQEYYDSVVEYLANELQVDFIKLDDVVDYPREIEAFAKAVEKVERPIVLSLSPGQETYIGNWDVISRWGNMCRITGDVWDLDSYNSMKFDRWALLENVGGPDCWLDLDMIPIGGIQVHIPENTDPKFYPVLGCRRRSNMSLEGKRVMMTQFALAASPLFYGGDLSLSNEEDFSLVTDPYILACNRNGVVGKRIFHCRHIDIRRAVNKEDPKKGWLGIFNREEASNADRVIVLHPEEMGFTDGKFPEKMYDVWNRKWIRPDEKNVLTMALRAHGVIFIQYE